MCEFFRVLHALEDCKEPLERLLADPEARAVLRIPRGDVPTCVKGGRVVAGITGYVLVDNFRVRVEQCGPLPWDAKKVYEGEQLVITPNFELLLLTRTGEYVPGKDGEDGGWVAEVCPISAAQAEERFGRRRICAALARPLQNALVPPGSDS